MSLLWWIVVAFALIVFIFVVFCAATIYKGLKEPLPSALSALGDLDDGVTVAQISNGRVFLSGKQRKSIGFVYMQGGFVDARAYAPVCREISKQTGCPVVLLDFPIRLAYLGMKRIPKALSEVPDVTSWVVGGHSLGGVGAIKFLLDARSDRDLQKPILQADVVGVVLHASYNNVDFTKKPIPDDIAVLQVLADSDGIIDNEKVEKFKSSLPSTNTSVVTIKGGNHAGFGQYSPTPHKLRGKIDGDCSIGLEQQQREVVDITVQWLTTLCKSVSGA